MAATRTSRRRARCDRCRAGRATASRSGASTRPVRRRTPARRSPARPDGTARRWSWRTSGSASPTRSRDPRRCAREAQLLHAHGQPRDVRREAPGQQPAPSRHGRPGHRRRGDGLPRRVAAGAPLRRVRRLPDAEPGPRVRRREDDAATSRSGDRAPPVRLAAARGYNILFAPFAASMVFGTLADAVAKFKELARAAGHPNVKAACSYFTAIADSEAEVRAAKERLVFYLKGISPAFPHDMSKAPPSLRYFKEIVDRIHAMTPDQVGERSILTGGRDDVVAHLKRL